MYRNFSLTDEERKQIMEQHAAHGYKKPLNEQSLTNNQRLAMQKGYGPVDAAVADQLGKEGKLLPTAPNKEIAPASAPASGAAEVKAPDINVNCAASLSEIKEGSMKILKVGCKTDAVKELQKMLGMEEKYQTGYFGNMTKGKVIEFQKANKDAKGVQLVPDGKVGDKTLWLLQKLPPLLTQIKQQLTLLQTKQQLIQLKPQPIQQR
jgi:peptidoglycan hydrolase-like protein with peptidoglycan-binding domain